MSKPRRQMDDLVRSELELEKNLPSPILSTDCSQSSFDPIQCDDVPSEDVNAANVGPTAEELEQQADRKEEERIRQLEIDRIEMQEARKKAEEERMLQQRVDEIRRQQVLFYI